MGALSVLCLACPLHGIAQEAQDTLVLDLQQVISLALEQSPTARSARHSFLSQHWNYRNFRANYLPSVTLTSSPYINNQINKITQGDGSSLYLRQSQLGADLNLSINQNISWTGGTFFIKTSANYHRELSSHTNMFSTVPISIGYQPVRVADRQHRNAAVFGRFPDPSAKRISASLQTAVFPQSHLHPPADHGRTVGL